MDCAWPYLCLCDPAPLPLLGLPLPLLQFKEISSSQKKMPPLVLRGLHWPLYDPGELEMKDLIFLWPHPQDLWVVMLLKWLGEKSTAHILQWKRFKLATVIPPVNRVLLNRLSYTEGYWGHFIIFPRPSRPSRSPPGWHHDRAVLLTYDWLHALLCYLYANPSYWSWLLCSPSFLHSLSWGTLLCLRSSLPFVVLNEKK